MTTSLAIAVSLVGVLALYFLSSGLAFVLLYRMGGRFPKRVAGALFAPLELLSRHSAVFRRAYNGLHLWAYRRFVGGPTYGGWPPPP